MVLIYFCNFLLIESFGNDHVLLIYFKLAKMGGKPDRSVPGPGYYTISNSPRGPKFSIGGAKIDPLFAGRGSSPGPGSYSLNDEVEKRLLGGRFSDSKRPELKPNDNPGPGFYNWKAALWFQGNKNVSFNKMYIFENGPAYTVKSKSPDKKKETSPGPGQYSPKLIKKKTKKFYVYRKKGTTKEI